MTWQHDLMFACGRFSKSRGLSASVSFLASPSPSPHPALTHSIHRPVILCSRTARKRLLRRLLLYRFIHPLLNLIWETAVSQRSRQRQNRPRSIYQYSSMAPRLSGQNCKFFKFLLSLNSQKRLGYKENNTKYRSLTWKPRSHVRILIYRMWPIRRQEIFSEQLFSALICFKFPSSVNS